MTPRPFVFFVVLTGISVLSTVVVVGFAVPPLSSSNNYSPSYCSTTTMLRYVAETNHHDEQYHRSRPHDVKVVDVEIEGNSQFVYIPLHEMENAVNKAQENHDQDCASMQNIIDEQREEVKRLKERNQKSDLADRMQYDHLSKNAEANWGENHEEKMKCATDRLYYLTNENKRLQVELDGERQRFELEKGRLQRKLEEARDETAEAQQILSLERRYFETAIKLLEVGLERETENVKALEDQLLEYNQLGYHGNHHHPFHDDLPPFESWEASSAYEQRLEHHHNEFHQHPYYREEGFEEFQPKVRPQEVALHYPQDNHSHSQHEALYQAQEPQAFHRENNGQTSRQHSYASLNTGASMRRPVTATTTVMGASSIRDNLGINNLGVNDIRDPLYR